MTITAAVPTLLRLVADDIAEQFPQQANDLRIAAIEAQRALRSLDEIVQNAQEEARMAEKRAPRKKWKPNVVALEALEEMLWLEELDEAYDNGSLAPGNDIIRDMERVLSTWREGSET
jgi:hypothetical protein